MVKFQLKLTLRIDCVTAENIANARDNERDASGKVVKSFRQAVQKDFTEQRGRCLVYLAVLNQRMSTIDERPNLR